MKITSDLTNLTTAILVLTVQMFIEWSLHSRICFSCRFQITNDILLIRISNLYHTLKRRNHEIHFFLT
jgi:hypothetical protein